MNTKKVIKLDSTCGSYFNSVAKQAKEKTNENTDVCFEFNGRTVTVSQFTSLDNLYRDFSNSFLMGWLKIGPECVEEYDSATLFEMAAKKKQLETDNAIASAKHKESQTKKLSEFESKVSGVEMDFSNRELWEEGKSKNTDEYGAAIYKYAENWARLMQVGLTKDSDLTRIADTCSHDADAEGITGFMFGAAVSILSSCWVHGEKLRVWHNAKHNHSGGGVVNPAILTISS